jgi:hypothetical protein
VLEAEPPWRFTQRFRGALARAAASLQVGEQAGRKVAGDPISNQVEAALASFVVDPTRKIRAEHIRMVRDLHLASLPKVVRDLLGI